MHPRSIALASVIAATAVTAPAASAQPFGSGGITAPAYPGNTLTLSQKQPLVAGTIIKTRLSGHADWGGLTSSTTTPYSLHLFPQDASVSPTCDFGFSVQRQKYINVPSIKAAGSFSAFVLDGSLVVRPAVPARSIDWAIDSPPYVIREGVKRVLLCGYVRLITDDVAAFSLPVKVTPQACRFSDASVRRGRSLALRCNVSGAVSVTYTRGKSKRRVAATISAKDGRVRLSTRKLARGTYRVAVRAGKDQLGRTLKLKIG